MAKAPQGQHIRPGHKYIRRWWDAKAGRWRYEYYVPKNPREKVGHAVVLPAPHGQVAVAIDYDKDLVQHLKKEGGRWNNYHKEWRFEPSKVEDFHLRVGPLTDALYTPHAFERVRPHLDKGAAEIPPHPGLEVGPVEAFPPEEEVKKDAERERAGGDEKSSLLSLPMAAAIDDAGGKPVLVIRGRRVNNGLDRDTAVQVYDLLHREGADLELEPLDLDPGVRVYQIHGTIPLRGTTPDEQVQEAVQILAPLAYAQGRVALGIFRDGKRVGGLAIKPKHQERGTGEEALEAPTPPPPPAEGGKESRGKKARGKVEQPPLFPPEMLDLPLFKLAKALGVGPGTRLVLKAETHNIPVSRLKWVDRPSERAEVPASHYLLPKEKKFPYRNKDGSINCRLLRAAISRAAQHGYKEVEAKARRLYQKHCKGEGG